MSKLCIQAVNYVFKLHLPHQSNKTFFSSLEELECGVVYMANDTSYKIKGIDEVQLQIHDRTTRRLTYVWFVPDIKKNLISLAILVGKDLYITFKYQD